MPPPLPSIMVRLRAETRDAHLSLEEHLRGVGVTDSVAAYTSYLGRMLGLVGPIEQAFGALDGWERVMPDAAERQGKASLLWADLAALGASPRVARCERVPPLRDHAQALGVAYVLEGSTLGGAVLAREVTQRLGEQAPTHFFRCYGDRLGARWSSFQRALGAFIDAQPGAESAVIAGAVTTFRLFHDWFKQGDPLA